jgi:hypothetical protein
MPDYTTHYALTALLDTDPALIPSPDVCNSDIEIMYAAIMDRLAQPLLDGTESPFSGRNPLSAESHLVSNLVYLLAIHGHECNLVPNLIWLQNLRLQGVTLRQAEYPLLTLEFLRSPSSTSIFPVIVIPAGTKVFSRLENGLTAITLQDIQMTGDKVQVVARLGTPGKNVNVRADEFTGASGIAGVQSVTGVEMLSYGSNLEGVEDAVLRARLNTQLQNRTVVPRDWYQTCLDLGCQKANVLPGVDPANEGYFADHVLVVVYPGNLSVLVNETLTGLKGLDTRCLVIAPDIINLTGTIAVRATPDLTDAQAIAQCNVALTTSINPPYGTWGDLNLVISIATALEKTIGIFAMTSAELFFGNMPLADLSIKPWQLFNVTPNWVILR